MANVEFTDYSAKVQTAITDAVIAWLYEVGGEIEAQTKRNTPVDTGQLEKSWTHVVDESKGEVVIGSPLENAIWTEFGTGEYALNGDGRKKPWRYEDVYGNWHTTTGKKPQRCLFNAFQAVKPKAIKALENKLKGM